MKTISDNALTALALREHAQTCEEIGSKHPTGSDSAQRWVDRARRCREIAVRMEHLDNLGATQPS